MATEPTCSNGCCRYHRTEFRSPWWEHDASGEGVNFCPRDGTRLNADGTADPGSVAWANREALEAARKMVAIEGIASVKVSGWHTADETFWWCDVEDYVMQDVATERADDPAAAILAAKKVLDANAHGDQTRQVGASLSASLVIPTEYGYGTLSDGGSELDFDGGCVRSRELAGGEVYVSNWCGSASEALAQTAAAILAAKAALNSDAQGGEADESDSDGVDRQL